MSLYSHHEIPGFDDFLRLREELQDAGIRDAVIDTIDPSVAAWMLAQLSAIETCRSKLRAAEERCHQTEADVIRLRGQRDTLRQTLMRRHQEDPMMGHLSDPRLTALPATPLEPNSRRA